MSKIKMLLVFFLLILSQQLLGETKPYPIRVMLDWFLNPNHAPLIVAEQQGFFKKYHLTVTLITPSDPSDTLKLVAANQSDIGITYEPQFLLQ